MKDFIQEKTAKIQKLESVEKQKKIKLADVLKDRTDINLLVEWILDQWIELSVHDLIKALPLLHKVLFSSVEQLPTLRAHGFDDKWKLIVNDIDYEINDTEHDLVNQLNNSEKEILYAAGVLKISIVIEENNTVKWMNAMIDSGMEINVLHKSVADWLRLVITLLWSENDFCNWQLNSFSWC